MGTPTSTHTLAAGFESYSGDCTLLERFANELKLWGTEEKNLSGIYKVSAIGQIASVSVTIHNWLWEKSVNREDRSTIPSSAYLTIRIHMSVPTYMHVIIILQFACPTQKGSPCVCHYIL